MLACWEVCVLVLHQIDLCHLGVTCHLLDVSGGHLWTFHFLSKLPDLTCWEIVQIYIAVIYGFRYKFFILEKEPKISLWGILTVSRGYLARPTWVWTALYHSFTNLFPYQKLVRRSNWAFTSFDWGLQNSSNFSQIVSSINSSVDRLQEAYWSMPKSPLKAITFLYFLLSESISSSQSRIFLHFKCHFRNMWYRASLTVQSILRPVMQGMNMLEIRCVWDGWKVTFWSCSSSELDNSS